jgi:hypothetical protein
MDDRSANEEEVLRRLVARLPPEYLPWPFGMPTSTAPQVVVIGASPGNSPAAGRGTPSGQEEHYGPPTIGRAHPGFYYPDAAHYWAKVRSLCAAVARCKHPGASEEEALSVCGHFNLGTGMAGTATLGAVEAPIVRWVSGLMGSELPVEVIVGVGLNAILRTSEVSKLWNATPGGLQVEWERPQMSRPFQSYRFRLWQARRADGESVLVCLWPNHPSRHPFTGPPGRVWEDSVEQFCRIVQERST